MGPVGHGAGEMGVAPRGAFFAFSISMVCHLVLFVGMVYSPRFDPDRIYKPSVIDVSIVALPSPRRALPETDRKPRIRRASEPQPRVSRDERKKTSKTPSAAPGPYKKKVSLKKKTFKPTRVVKRALSRIEEKLETSRAEPVLEAIDDLKKTLDETAQRERDPEPVSPETSTVQSKRALELMDIYKAEIPYQIQKNWSFSEQLAGGRTDLVAWLIIEIRPDGFISDIWFERRSGNRYFDDQAFKAVRKSNPLPPLPEGYKRPYFNVGLRFTPSGLK